MDRFECFNIDSKVQPAIYVTYIVVNNTDEALRMVQNFDNQHKTIKFELELPSDDGYLPILDTAIKVNADGSLSYRLHTNKASKKIT